MLTMYQEKVKNKSQKRMGKAHIINAFVTLGHTGQYNIKLQKLQTSESVEMIEHSGRA